MFSTLSSLRLVGLALTIAFSLSHLTVQQAFGQRLPRTPGDGEAGLEAAEAPLPVRPIQAIALAVQPPPGELPRQASSEAFAASGEQFQVVGYSRPWRSSTYAWTAPVLAYKPLYFQEEQLERYGQHYGYAQPLVSAVKFFGRMPLIPYMLGATPPGECQYALGYYRPGDCTPHYFTTPKLSLKGAFYQAAATTGSVFLIP